MTGAERRAHEVAAIVTKNAAEWNAEREEELVAALVQMQQYAVREAMVPLLKACASELRPCTACGEELAMMRTRHGKFAPYSLKTCVNHFAGCPKADQFRREKEVAGV